MQSTRSIFLKWALTILALIGGTAGVLCAEEVRTGELRIHTNNSEPQKVAAITSDARHSNADMVAVAPSGFVPAGYKLVWDEEFDGTTLDLSKWIYRSEGQSSDGSGVSVLSRDCVSLNGHGQLVITTKEKDGVLQTGMISTTGTFEPLYGYFEARIRFQEQQGHHGAFWLKSTSYGKFPGDPVRAGVEIDVAEFFGSGRSDGGVGINVYWNGEDGETVRRTGRANLKAVLQSESEQLCDRFHIFSLLWTPTEYVFFIDGHEMFAIEEGISRRGQPIILSLLSHNWEHEKLDREKLDDSMLVDYVRAYQKTQPQLSGRPTR